MTPNLPSTPAASASRPTLVRHTVLAWIGIALLYAVAVFEVNLQFDRLPHSPLNTLMIDYDHPIAPLSADGKLLADLEAPARAAFGVSEPRNYYLQRGNYGSEAGAYAMDGRYQLLVKQSFIDYARKNPDAAAAVLAHELRHVVRHGTWRNPSLRLVDWPILVVIVFLLLLMHRQVGPRWTAGALLLAAVAGLVFAWLGVYQDFGDQMIVALALVLALCFAWMVTDPQGRPPFWRFAGCLCSVFLCAALVQPTITRHSETDADQGAGEVMRTVGKPEALVTMFCWLESESPTRGDRWPWLQTHPDNDVRLKDLGFSNGLQLCPPAMLTPLRTKPT